MSLDVTQFGFDLAKKLMEQGAGVFQGTPLRYWRKTTNAHVPGQSYQGPIFVEHPTPVNGILAAPGNNEVRAADPATLHTRRYLVRTAEIPQAADVGDRWLEPDGEVYEVTALPWGDPAQATLWLVGERSTTP